jgi:hypothetical protein
MGTVTFDKNAAVATSLRNTLAARDTQSLSCTPDAAIVLDGVGPDTLACATPWSIVSR